MRQPIIAANWKLNMLQQEAQDFVVAFRARWKTKTEESVPEVVIAPPFTALETTRRALTDSNVDLAGQNVFFESSGAFTGEISPAMLRDAGCRYCIVGHSERRAVNPIAEQFSPPLPGMPAMRAALTQLGLSEYCAAFEEHGFDDLHWLQQKSRAADKL